VRGEHHRPPIPGEVTLNPCLPGRCCTLRIHIAQRARDGQSSIYALEEPPECFVGYCNRLRYHEALRNVTPADVYFGRQEEILVRRKEVLQRTIEEGRRFNKGVTWSEGSRPLG